MKRYILIDGHSIIYRSYYAFIRNPLRNSKGFNTSAIYGFINMLKKIQKRFTPEYLAVMFDTGKKTFRHDQYEQYKATRKPPPDDLPPQIPVIKKLINALGINSFELDGYEADDLLATFGRGLSGDGEVYIVTSDKDLLQVVGGNVFVFDPYRDLVYDAKTVAERFGVDPDRIVDLLSVAGDASDNVPGVPGFGFKRARALIDKFGSIDQAIKGDSSLQKFAEEIKFYRSLLTVDQGVPIEVKDDEVRIGKQDDETLSMILRELEFYQLMRDFFSKEEDGDYKPGSGKITRGRYGISVDGQIYLAEQEGKARAFPGSPENLKSLNTSELIGFSIKDVVKTLGIRPERYEDIEIGVQIINPDHHLKDTDIILKYLGQPVESLSQYQAADYARRLAPIIKKRIEKLELDEVFKLEHNLLPIIVAMEERGIKVDTTRLVDFKRTVDKERAGLEFEIYRLAGQSFNINSPRQLAHILFDILGLKPIKKKKTGYSTDSTVLLELGKSHPLPEKILTYREKAKLASTYLNPIHEMIGERETRIHTTFNQLGAATGRLSSSNPNLQNIPASLKGIFVAEKGYKFISGDYSQIELRILAHLSSDQNLIRAFEKGVDIHRRTAQELFNIPDKDVQEHHRRVAKMVNYGIIYGLSEYGLAGGLHISREDARAIIERHHSLYPDVQHWIDGHIEQVAEVGETRTIIGRRRGFSPPLTEAKIRAAINSPIQGSAADLIKMAMIRIEQRLADMGIGGGIIVQVHDELLLEIREEKVNEVVEIVREEMENVYKLKVPILVNIGIGDDWQQAH